MQKISKRTGGKYKVALLAGHNSEGFDRDFLFKWSKRISPKTFLPVDWFTLDTMQMKNTLDILSALKKGGIMKRKSLKLGDLADIEKAHDAMSDVEATVELAKSLTKVLGGGII